MATNWVDVTTKTLPAVIPLTTALFAATRGTGAARDRLKHDIELIEKLPEDSEARTQLLILVRDEIKQIREFSTARRDVSSMVMALVTAPLVWYLTVWLFRHDGWWAVPASLLTGTLASVLTFGIFESAERVPRDSKGKRLPLATSAADDAPVPEPRGDSDEVSSPRP